MTFPYLSKGAQVTDKDGRATTPLQAWMKAVEAVATLFTPTAVIVANLPATARTGARAFVTDANATTFASTVAGGGSNPVPVYFDGSNWKIG